MQQMKLKKKNCSRSHDYNKFKRRGAIPEYLLFPVPQTHLDLDNKDISVLSSKQ